MCYHTHRTREREADSEAVGGRREGGDIDADRADEESDPGAPDRADKPEPIGLA
ncbi:MAG: hypothetical protein ABEK02_02035 [Haloquadratum sp.]